MDENNTKDTVEDLENKPEADTEKKVDNISDISDYIDEDKREIDLLNEKIEDLTNIVKRTQADFMNYKRRTEEERQSISLFANEMLLTELLIVIDNFDRALSQENVEKDSFFEGISLIRKQIYSILEKNGITEIDTNIKFDPNIHYAVMQEDTGESDNILEVLQKGYLLKDKVIRPAMVKVSK